MALASFELAGLPFVAEPAAGGDPVTLPGSYTPFLRAPASSPAARFLICGTGGTARLPAPAESEIVWSGPTWRAGRTEDGGWGIQIHSVRDEGWHTVAHADGDFGQARILPLAGRFAGPSPHALNYPYDQALLSNRLARFRACVVHGSGLAIDGGGYLFCGRSGIGKTTIARLWRARGATLLNDDRSLVRVTPGGVELSSSPWHGEDPEINALTLPLRAIFHLGQSPANRLTPLAPAAAAARLVATSVLPFYLEASMELALEVMAQIGERVPAFHLDFTPDERVLELISRDVIDR